MSIDLTHDAGHFPGGSFSRFRVYVAQCIGIHLPAMEGYGSMVHHRDPSHAPNIPWQSVPYDPAIHLLWHHDDHPFTPYECFLMARRLRQLRPAFVRVTRDEPKMLNRLDQFIAGCDRAVEAFEMMEIR